MIDRCDLGVLYAEFAAAIYNCALHCPLDAREASCTVDAQHLFYPIRALEFELSELKVPYIELELTLKTKTGAPLFFWKCAFPDCKAITDYSCMCFYCYIFIIMYIIHVKSDPLKLMTFFLD